MIACKNQKNKNGKKELESDRSTTASHLLDHIRKDKALSPRSRILGLKKFNFWWLHANQIINEENEIFERCKKQMMNEEISQILNIITNNALFIILSSHHSNTKIQTNIEINDQNNNNNSNNNFIPKNDQSFQLLCFNFCCFFKQIHLCLYLNYV